MTLPVRAARSFRLGLACVSVLVAGIGAVACAGTDGPDEPTFAAETTERRPVTPPSVLKGELSPTPIDPQRGGRGGAGTDAGLPGSPAPGRPDAGPPASVPVTLSASSQGRFTLLPTGALTPCSMEGPAAELAVVNLRERAVTLAWVDHTCKEIVYGGVEAKELTRMSTFATHRWRIRDEATGALLADFTLDTAGTFTATAW